MTKTFRSAVQSFSGLGVAVAVAVGLTGCPEKGATTETSPASGPSSMPAKVGAAGGAAAEHGADHDAHGAEAKVGRETVDADGIVRRGTKLSDLTAITVSEATSKAAELDGKLVKVSGKVESVCQPMGCWFVIEGATPDERIRVSSKGHDIFVPKAAAGREAVVEGELKVKTISKETAQHFEDERALKPGEEKKVFTEDQKELSLAIVGLEMRPAAT